MRVLVIEDNEYRRRFFLELLKGHEVETALTATEALAKLQSTTYDVIYLDYDLDNNEKGIEVARKLPATLNSNSEVIIHSMNITNAKRIQRILPYARIYPFAEMHKKSLASLLCLFGTERAKENFLRLCREYYGERVRQEAAEHAGQPVTGSRRAEIHNQIMEVVQKLYLRSNDPMPSRKDVGVMIMEYFRRFNREG